MSSGAFYSAVIQWHCEFLGSRSFIKDGSSYFGGSRQISGGASPHLVSFLHLSNKVIKMNWILTITALQKMSAALFERI